MTAVFVIAGIAVMMAAFSIAYYKRDIVELFVMGLTGFFCAYVLASGILFWMDKFGIHAALKITLVAGIVFMALVTAVIKRRPTAVFHYKESMIPLAVFVLMLIVMHSKFGYFGMGQDQGVYQVKALALIYDENSNIYSFDEYGRLEEKTDIESYEYEAVHSLVGFYGYDSKVPVLDKADFPDKLTGVLHGIPTYSAMLALYGSLFGYANMADLQTVLMFMGLFLMYYVMRNLRVNKKLRLAGLLIFGCSPIVLWTAKATLTEIFIFVLIMLYLYLMADRKYPQYACMSFVPIVVFAFFHATIYTIMPMIVIAYFILYYMTRDKQYMWADVGALAGYLAGFYMMRACASVYTYGNYKKIFILGINADNLAAVVTAVVVVCMALAFALLYVPMEKQEKFREFFTRGIRKHMRLVVRILLVASIAVLILTFMHTKMRFSYSTFYAYVISSGIVPVIFLFAAFIYRPQFITAHKDHLLLTIMFVYMVIMYSCVFKPSIAYYYYYARYIVPYLPVIIILTMLRISRIDAKAGAKKFVITLAVAGIYAVLMLPNNIALATQKDITNMSWDIVEDLSAKFSEGDAVIIDSALASTLKFPVKIMTHADVYPVTDNLKEQIGRLEQDHDRVYYITTTDWFLFKDYGIDNIYSNVNDIYYDESETQSSVKKSGINPFPTKFSVEKQLVNVYRCSYTLE